MDSLIDQFNELRLSAFSKSKKINNYVHDQTIGPESTNDKTIIIKNNEMKPNSTKTITVRNNSQQTVTCYDNNTMYNKLTNRYELNRLEKVQEAINERKENIINITQKIKRENNQQWNVRQQLLAEEMKRQEENILKVLEEECDNEMKKNSDQIVRYYQQLAEIRKQKDRELQEENERKEISKILYEIKKDQIACQKMYEKIIELIGSCKPEIVEKYTNQLKNIPTEMAKICQNCSQGNINKQEADKAKDILKTIINVYEQIKETIAKNEKLKQEEQIKSEEQKQMKLQQQKQVNTNELDKVGSDLSIKIFDESKNYLKETELELQELINNDSLKQFRFDCYKAINIPVNAISAASRQHLHDKYVRLSNLLSGHNVQIGDKTINANSINLGIKYCMDLLARKFVLQSDLLISSNPEAAFCYATIILSLWHDFPQFGKLLLAHFYIQCPYLVPVLILKANNQTDEEFYKVQGYRYNTDGTIEMQDKYLKRLTGFMRLYSAIIVGMPKSADRDKTPYGIDNGWRWISCMLNLPPKPDVTATLIYSFLQNVGAKMESIYKKQFVKIMQFLNDNYMPLLKKVDDGGPVTRLEVLLLNYKQKGHFEKPAGFLPDDFW